MDKDALPLGFGLALAQNEDAMRVFTSLSQQEKQAVIDRTKSVRSKSEMRQLIAGLTDGNFPQGMG